VCFTLWSHRWSGQALSKSLNKDAPCGIQSFRPILWMLFDFKILPWKSSHREKTNYACIRSYSNHHSCGFMAQIIAVMKEECFFFNYMIGLSETFVTQWNLALECEVLSKLSNKPSLHSPCTSVSARHIESRHVFRVSAPKFYEHFNVRVKFSLNEGTDGLHARTGNI